MAAPLRIVLCGSEGRMGRRIAALAAGDPRFSISAGIDRKNRGELAAALKAADALVDFSAPAASIGFCAAAAGTRTPAVVGTTGFTPAQLARLRQAARRTAILLSANMSPGMNLLLELVSRAASALPRYDAAVAETHHALKKDAPSGSALRLADCVRRARGARAAVSVVSIRAGDVIGDHTVLLAGPDERIELTHRAHSRDAFARGALAAALWLSGRKPGLYSMRDMLAS